MPEVRNCRRCGRVYNYIGGLPICPVCKDNDEKDFKRVKDYLYEYPKAPMSQVSAELGISIEKIRNYLKEGRLEIIEEDGNFILECENCGKSIRTGRLCSDCSKSISNEIQSTANRMSNNVPRPSNDQNSTQKGHGMRYLNKHDK